VTRRSTFRGEVVDALERAAVAGEPEDEREAEAAPRAGPRERRQELRLPEARAGVGVALLASHDPEQLRRVDPVGTQDQPRRRDPLRAAVRVPDEHDLARPGEENGHPVEERLERLESRERVALEDDIRGVREGRQGEGVVLGVGRRGAAVGVAASAGAAGASVAVTAGPAPDDADPPLGEQAVGGDERGARLAARGARDGARLERSRLLRGDAGEDHLVAAELVRDLAGGGVGDALEAADDLEGVLDDRRGGRGLVLEKDEDGRRRRRRRSRGG